MKTQQIEFSLTAEQMLCLAAFIAGLNQNGVPYTLRKDELGVRVSVSNGF